LKIRHLITESSEPLKSFFELLWGWLHEVCLWLEMGEKTGNIWLISPAYSTQKSARRVWKTNFITELQLGELPGLSLTGKRSQGLWWGRELRRHHLH